MRVESVQSIKEMYREYLNRSFTKHSLNIYRHNLSLLYLQQLLLDYSGVGGIDKNLNFIYWIDAVDQINKDPISIRIAHLSFADSALFYLSFFPKHINRLGLSADAYRGYAQGAYRQSNVMPGDVFDMMSNYFIEYESALSYIKKKYLMTHLRLVQ